MPVRCSICSSEKGLELSKALLAGESFRSIVSLFPSFSFGAVSRHSRKCLNRKISTKANPNPQKCLPVRSSGFSKQVSPEPTNRITDPYDAEVEDLALSAQAARDKGDLRLALQFSALKLRAMDIRAREREKMKPEKDDKTTGFEEWATIDLQALQAVKEFLEARTVTAEEIQGFLESKRPPQVTAIKGDPDAA